MNRSEKTILKIDHVSKQYNIDGKDVDILSDINLEVKEGEFISIVGFSGCGKSTLLKLILGLEPVTDGTVYINDKKVSEPVDECGMIFQEPRLCGWKTVSGNIGFGIKEPPASPFGRQSLKKRLDKQQRADLIHDQLKLVGLEQFEKAYPSQLSGGMQQRVSIARALISDPEILLLDEPFGALDAFTRMNMQNELLDIWQKKKKTMILVTHDIDEAIYLSDRIIVLSRHPGQVKEIINVEQKRPRDRSRDEFMLIRKKILVSFWGSSDKSIEYYI